ncbi:MAG TPA: hypothetical protein PKE16_04145 [Hyphomicrobium sp.]|nr:hypothetical protein [Hyphomicrobium sp.]
MDSRLTQLERAFELASSGRCTTVAEIKRKLREEGYMDDQVEGPLLFGQLNSLMKKSNRESGRQSGSGSNSSPA